MKNYCIWIVSPAGYIHSHAFDEIALSLSWAFRELGYDVPIIRDSDLITEYPIILGANLISSLGTVDIPETAIVYNMEQILPGSPWMTEDYVNILRSYELWDYSKKNIAELNNLGITNVKFCGLGYTSVMTRIEPAPYEFDILLYGSINDRRYNILNQLHNLGYTVKALFGVYGKDRDYYIARSKIILNIHFYESRILEIGRIYDLMANRRFIISETGSDDALEKPFSDSMVLAPYDRLVETCVRYLKEDDSRNIIAEKGFSKIQTVSQTRFLQYALKN
jgi:hypothetical protein